MLSSRSRQVARSVRPRLTVTDAFKQPRHESRMQKRREDRPITAR
jgi:hypothetical protein